MAKQEPTFSGRASQRLRLSSTSARITTPKGELYTFPELGTAPYLNRPGWLLLSGMALLSGGKPCTSDFYLGIYNPVQNEATFWLATEPERLLLYSLYDRELLSAEDMASIVAGEASQDDIWVDVESAEQRADRKRGKDRRPIWHRSRAVAAMHFVERSYKRRVEFGRKPHYRICYRRQKLEVELVSLVGYLDSGNRVSYLGPASHKFFSDWLKDLQRARKGRDFERQAP